MRSINCSPEIFDCLKVARIVMKLLLNFTQEKGHALLDKIKEQCGGGGSEVGVSLWEESAMIISRKPCWSNNGHTAVPILRDAVAK